MLLGFMVGLLHAIRSVYSSQVHIWVNTEGCQHVHKRRVIISDHNNSVSGILSVEGLFCACGASISSFNNFTAKL